MPLFPNNIPDECKDVIKSVFIELGRSNNFFKNKLFSDLDNKLIESIKCLFSLETISCATEILNDIRLQIDQFMFDELVANKIARNEFSTFEKANPFHSYANFIDAQRAQIQQYNQQNKHLMLDKPPFDNEIKHEPKAMTSLGDVSVKCVDQTLQGSNPRAQLESPFQLIDSEKDRYLSSLKTTGMLGHHEAILFTHFFKRPLVVVRELEQGPIVDSVYGDQYSDVKPIFVVNDDNVHFDGWYSESSFLIKPGEPCVGYRVMGNKSLGSYGTNDCFIAAIRTDPEANQSLNETFESNQSIRQWLVNQHDMFNPSVSYCKDRPISFRQEIYRVVNAQENPVHIKDYVGIVLHVVSPDKLHDVDLDSQDYDVWSDIKNGKRFGTWFISDKNGRFELNYGNSGLELERIQTHRRDSDLIH